MATLNVLVLLKVIFPTEFFFFQRDTNYEIVVTSFNLQGESPPSSPHTIYVGEAVPTGTPRNVKATPLSPTEIKIDWEVSEGMNLF